MFQLSSPGREGEKLLLQYSRIHDDRWEWVAYEGNWNPDSREFAIRQAVFKTEDRTVLDENGMHTWQMNRNASKSAQPPASEAADWEGRLACSTRHVITNNAWHENWRFATWNDSPFRDLISHAMNQSVTQCHKFKSMTWVLFREGSLMMPHSLKFWFWDSRLTGPRVTRLRQRCSGAKRILADRQNILRCHMKPEQFNQSVNETNAINNIDQIIDNWWQNSQNESGVGRSKQVGAWAHWFCQFNLCGTGPLFDSLACVFDTVCIIIGGSHRTWNLFDLFVNNWILIPSIKSAAGIYIQLNSTLYRLDHCITVSQVLHT